MALPYFSHKGITVDCFGLPAFIQGVERAKILQIRFMREAFKRGGKQIRKMFIKTQLSGPPGIKGGELKKGKNVFAYVYGEDLEQIGMKVGISRILHVHEVGMTIRSKGGGPLYLQARSMGTRIPFQRGSKEESSVIAVTNQVVIPARRQFRLLARSMGPAIMLKVASEAKRATEIVLTAALKSVTRKF
jgi:hypothetical protein